MKWGDVISYQRFHVSTSPPLTKLMPQPTAIVAVGVAFLEVAFVATAEAIIRAAVVAGVAIRAVLGTHIVAVAILIAQVRQVVAGGWWSRGGGLVARWFGRIVTSAWAWARCGRQSWPWSRWHITTAGWIHLAIGADTGGQQKSEQKKRCKFHEQQIPARITRGVKPGMGGAACCFFSHAVIAAAAIPPAFWLRAASPVLGAG